MKEYWTALLLMRLLCMLYTHWMMYPLRACTLPTPLIVTLCSVLLWTEYIAPGKAAPRSWPPSNVPLCIQLGSKRISLCLQMMVSWSEQCPWTSRETLKAAVRCQQQGIYESKAQESVITLYTVCRQVLMYMYSAFNTSYCKLSETGSKMGRNSNCKLSEWYIAMGEGIGSFIVPIYVVWYGSKILKHTENQRKKTT